MLATDRKPSAHPMDLGQRIDHEMIVEPASINSRSPIRRLLRAAGFVAPVALLATIVGAGLLGPKPAQDDRLDASASALAVVSPSAAPTRSPAASAPPAVPPSLAGFPATFRSLPALLPSAVLAARASSAGPPAVVVVAGYLALAGPATHCASPMITFGAWCDRLGTLFDSPTAGGLGASGARPAHLHVTVPPGVVLPSAVTGGSAAAAGPVAVEVIGRFGVAGSCGADPGTCDQGFVVERVVWAGDADATLRPLLEPRQGAGIALTPPASADQHVVTLLAVLARPATVARLDPAAGAAAARLGKIAGFANVAVWYMRDVVIADDGSLFPRWLLVDAYTGKMLATAPSDLPPVASAPQPSAGPRG